MIFSIQRDNFYLFPPMTVEFSQVNKKTFELVSLYNHAPHTLGKN